MNQTEKLNSICFWLIKQCVDANAKTMAVTQENVNFQGKPLGNWKITVEKI